MRQELHKLWLRVLTQAEYKMSIVFGISLQTVISFGWSAIGKLTSRWLVLRPDQLQLPNDRKEMALGQQVGVNDGDFRPLARAMAIRRRARVPPQSAPAPFELGRLQPFSPYHATLLQPRTAFFCLALRAYKRSSPDQR
jgi:hypothetical protein